MRESLRKAIDSSHETHLNKFHNTLKQLNLQQVPQFTLTGSGCREKSILMHLPVFRLALCIGFLTYNQETTYSIMITASHNPGSDNGIKIGKTDGKIIEEETFSLLQELLNSQAHFHKFISEQIEKVNIRSEEENKLRRLCFIGRDSRPSSPELSQVAKQALLILGIKIVDFGICTTPQLYSLSKQVFESIGNQSDLQNIDVEAQKQSYVKQTMKNFIQVWQKLHQPQKLQKSNILFDFSNGSGAISYLRYRPYLTEYLQIKQTHNIDFSNPNLKCGAEYIQKNWQFVQKSEQFGLYDECFFLDGDADRIIVKIKGLRNAFDGNYFTMFYTKVLQKISNKLQQSDIFTKNQSDILLQIHAVGTVVTNLGVKIQLKKQGIHLITTNVGILNLYKQVVKLKGWTVFFEPNGHGGIYVSKEQYLQVEARLKQYPQNLELKFLVSIYKILKNNSRGYGLHNMLVFCLCKKYLQISQEQISQLFTLMHEDQKLIHLAPEFDPFYRNGPQNNNELTQPKSVYQFIQDLTKKYQDYKIVVRKSDTTKCLVRINSQGIDQAACKDIVEAIGDFIEKFNLRK